MPLRDLVGWWSINPRLHHVLLPSVRPPDALVSAAG